MHTNSPTSAHRPDHTATPTQWRRTSLPRPRGGRHRSRWAAIGAAVAVTLGAGGFGLVSAAPDHGENPVLIPITPCRLLDTRPGAPSGGPFAGTTIGPATTWDVDAHGVNGQCDIPTDALALSANVTGLNATQTTFITLWPQDQPLPLASNLNLAPGTPPEPNLATIELSPAGQFSVYNESGNADLLIDIAGYYVDHDHEVDIDAIRSTTSATSSAVGVTLNDNGTSTAVLSTTIDTPVAGQVIVTSTATARTTQANLTIQCGIGSEAGTGIDLGYLQEWESGGAVGDRAQLAGTRRFTVNGGTSTFHLNCRQTALGEAQISNRAITAIFVPGSDPVGGITP